MKKLLKKLFVSDFHKYTDLQTHLITKQSTGQDQRITRLIARDLCKKNTIGTKLNHMTYLHDYWQYCILHGWDPFLAEPTPNQVVYWMRNRIDKLGSSNSIGGWQSSVMFWCKSNLNFSPKWIKDGFYNECYRTFVSLHGKKTQQRDPLQVEWIVRYIRKKGVTPATWCTVDLFTFKKCWLLIITYFSISRPFEITFTDKTENEMWEIITTGLKWGDITLNNTDKPYIRQYLHLIINWYKNQIDREIPKDIWMSPPICEYNKCICYQLDYIAMYKILKKRCIKFYSDELSKANISHNISANVKKILKNTEVRKDKFIFVGRNGAIWGPSKINEIVKDLKITLKLKDNLLGYSTRIGALSLCRKQQIDILKIIRYVIWSIKNVPHVSARYMRFNRKQLQIIPFEMIHGADKKGKPIINRRNGKLESANLWSDDLAQILFAEK